MRNILLIVLFIILHSCGDNKTSFKTINLEKESSFDRLADGTFFSDIRCMQIKNNSIYLADYNRSTLFEVDIDSKKLIQSIGRPGEGPGELNGLPFFYVNNNGYAYLQNDFKRCYEVYKGPKHQYSFRLPNDNFMLKFDYRFFVKNKKFYTSNGITKSPLLIINEDKSTSSIGKPYEFDAESLIKIRNNRNVLPYDNLIITLSDNMPNIQIFNNNLKLINDFSLAEIPLVNETLSYIDLKNQELNNSSYINLIKDVYINNDDLYILLSTYEPYEVNKLLKFKLNSNGGLILKNELHLSEKSVYSSICTSDSKLFAFNNQTSSIDIFNLP